jgi:hypothetical protein
MVRSVKVSRDERNGTAAELALQSTRQSGRAPRNHLFSDTERSFYKLLRRLTPGYNVFAKVRVADLVYAGAGAPTSTHLSGIDGKHVDFVVCDANLAPVLAIELDGLPSGLVDRRAGARSLDEVLAAAAIPLVHLPGQCEYVFDEIHRLLTPYLRVGTLML